jgi:hypothetical protein
MQMLKALFPHHVAQEPIDGEEWRDGRLAVRNRQVVFVFADGPAVLENFAFDAPAARAAERFDGAMSAPIHEMRVRALFLITSGTSRIRAI